MPRSSTARPRRQPRCFGPARRSEGALARPASYAHYQNADLALEAAVLAHGIAESQPFLDGNKRLALVAMLTFLEANGYRVDATDPELAFWIIDLSAHLTPEQLAETVRLRLLPGQPAWPLWGQVLGTGSGQHGQVPVASTPAAQPSSV